MGNTQDNTNYLVLKEKKCRRLCLIIYSSLITIQNPAKMNYFRVFQLQTCLLAPPLSVALNVKRMLLESASLSLLSFSTIGSLSRFEVGMDLKTEKHNELQKSFTVLVEGNIGSGKTSFLSHFSKYDSLILSEPVELWRNVQGHNMLELMYKDQARWSLAFQTIVQKTMLDLHIRRTSKPVKMMERSIFSARYCFVENLHRNNVLASPEYAVLDEWFKWIIKNINIRVDLIVYLRTDPEVVYHRMKQRARHEEAEVPLSYLQQLHQMHEDWLFNKTAFSCPASVVVVDANKELSQMAEEYEKCVSAILSVDQTFSPNATSYQNGVIHSPSKLIL